MSAKKSGTAGICGRKFLLVKKFDHFSEKFLKSRFPGITENTVPVLYVLLPVCMRSKSKHDSRYFHSTKIENNQQIYKQPLSIGKKMNRRYHSSRLFSWHLVRVSAGGISQNSTNLIPLSLRKIRKEYFELHFKVSLGLVLRVGHSFAWDQLHRVGTRAAHVHSQTPMV